MQFGSSNCHLHHAVAIIFDTDVDLDKDVLKLKFLTMEYSYMNQHPFLMMNSANADRLDHQTETTMVRRHKPGVLHKGIRMSPSELSSGGGQLGTFDASLQLLSLHPLEPLRHIAWLQLPLEVLLNGGLHFFLCIRRDNGLAKALRFLLRPEYQSKPVHFVQLLAIESDSATLSVLK